MFVSSNKLHPAFSFAVSQETPVCSRNTRMAMPVSTCQIPKYGNVSLPSEDIQLKIVLIAVHQNIGGELIIGMI